MRFVYNENRNTQKKKKEKTQIVRKTIKETNQNKKTEDKVG